MSSTAISRRHSTPMIPGHEIVGRIDTIGPHVEGLHLGDRVGIPWLGHTCGRCSYCQHGAENFCSQPIFTGYTSDAGFATAVVAHANQALADLRAGRFQGAAVLVP